MRSCTLTPMRSGSRARPHSRPDAQLHAQAYVQFHCWIESHLQSPQTELVLFEISNTKHPAMLIIRLHVPLNCFYRSLAHIVQFEFFSWTRSIFCSSPFFEEQHHMCASLQRCSNPRFSTSANRHNRDFSFIKRKCDAIMQFPCDVFWPFSA